MPAQPLDSMQDHLDAVEDRNRFSGVTFNGTPWDLSHLNAFALRVQIEQDLIVDVVVLFSCHCFTHDSKHDSRATIPHGELYRDGWEQRVLDPERLRLSRLFLPRMIHELPTRQIRVVADRENFFTLDVTDSNGQSVHYGVFFDVERDRRRKKRLLLRVQSAYPIAHLSKRQDKAGKVNFPVLIRAVYNGRTIRR
jgi:hypothetical protein